MCLDHVLFSHCAPSCCCFAVHLALAVAPAIRLALPVCLNRVLDTVLGHCPALMLVFALIIVLLVVIALVWVLALFVCLFWQLFLAPNCAPFRVSNVVVLLGISVDFEFALALAPFFDVLGLAPPVFLDLAPCGSPWGSPCGAPCGSVWPPRGASSCVSTQGGIAQANNRFCPDQTIR